MYSLWKARLEVENCSGSLNQKSHLTKQTEYNLISHESRNIILNCILNSNETATVIWNFHKATETISWLYIKTEIII